ncbi:MAG: hypothetical protein WA644_09440, partial [Candidatus Acidiferrales bacterium]
GRDEAAPLPRGTSPTALFTTNSPSLVIKAASDAYHRSVYSWQPGSRAVLIVEGRDLDVTRLSDNTFAAWFSDGHQEQIVTLNEKRVISLPLVLPNGGPRGWGACEGDSQHVVCIGDRPGMTEQDRDYDETGFTAVLVVDLAARQTNWFSVGDRTHFRFDQRREMVYVVDWDSPSSHRPVEAFDLAGKDRGEAPLRDIMPSSPADQYVESLAEDGSESWEVYNAATMTLVLKFNCDRAGCREGDNDYAPWNPKFTDQIVAIRSGGAYGKGGACDIYQLSPPRLLKPVPCVGLPAYDWSRDGRELATLQYEGNVFRREPVN